MKKPIIVDEWVFVIRRPAAGRQASLSVAVGNVDRRDRVFVQALAKVIEVWANAGCRGRGR